MFDCCSNVKRFSIFAIRCMFNAVSTHMKIDHHQLYAASSMLNFDIQSTLTTRCTINSTFSQRTVPPFINVCPTWSCYLGYILIVLWAAEGAKITNLRNQCEGIRSIISPKNIFHIKSQKSKKIMSIHIIQFMLLVLIFLKTYYISIISVSSIMDRIP